ncbi:MAG: penicillin-binding protein 2 [Lachnospiraceae bacterium]|jgi:peptidoglycan glycosyltransferase|nr:penicillin-binding protein 2 [Lachnospiraceae bacterium]
MKKASTEQKSRTSAKNRKNREFAIITYSFVGIFMMMMGYFAYFQIFRSEDFINSPYNTRQNTFAEHVIRGEILSSDGKTLAQTITGEDGSETRYYPYGSMFAHAVGYDSNGKSGIESFGNFSLLRSHAFFLEQVLNGIQDIKNPGDNVVTTLDYRVQEVAYQALGSNRGAVVVLEPSTGKILAMVSKPDFDPNSIAAEWENIISNTDSENSVLVNRTTQGLYPPGSTFKIITTLEYLREHPNYQDYSYECTGSIAMENTEIHCYNNAVHGLEDLETSFAKSCNTSYANIGLGLNKKKFAGLCNELLFHTDLPIAYPSNQSSFVLNADSNSDQVTQMAIGQGETLVTPMHMALITSAIANQGILMRPYMIDHTENYKGVPVKNYKPSIYGSLITEEEAKLLQGLMSKVVSDGTGSKLSGQVYQAAGKTGSAEFSNIKGESHAWFTGYASTEEKGSIVVTVIVENGGAGSAVAVPIAKQIFDTYFAP